MSASKYHTPMGKLASLESGKLLTVLDQIDKGAAGLLSGRVPVLANSAFMEAMGHVQGGRIGADDACYHTLLCLWYLSMEQSGYADTTIRELVDIAMANRVFESAILVKSSLRRLRDCGLIEITGPLAGLAIKWDAPVSFCPLSSQTWAERNALVMHSFN